MSTLAIIGAVAMIVISILIIVVVSLQEGKGDGNERGNEPKESVETWTCGEQYDADHEGDAAD